MNNSLPMPPGYPRELPKPPVSSDSTFLTPFPSKPPVPMWESNVDYQLQYNTAQISRLIDIIRLMQDRLRGLDNTSNIREIQEHLGELSAAQAQMTGFVNQNIAILTVVQRAIGLEARISHLETEIRDLRSSMLQKQGNRLMEIGVLVAIVFGIMGIIFAILK